MKSAYCANNKNARMWPKKIDADFKTDAELCFATLALTNGILVNKSTKNKRFLKGHDTTDNKSAETQLILLHLYTSKKRYNSSFT